MTRKRYYTHELELLLRQKPEIGHCMVTYFSSVYKHKEVNG